MTPELITIINELSIGSDGWAQIAPLGDYSGVALVPDGKGCFTKQRAIQRLDKSAVTQMASEYAQSSRGLSGFFKKRPLYEGHPDIPVGGDQYPNKHPVGLFHNLACRNGGLYGEPILTEEGERLIASKAYRALSGRWAAEFVGEENGVKIYRPVKFLSAGLTNQPNLPVQLINELQINDLHQSTINNLPSEALAKEGQPPSMNKIISWLSIHGVSLANDASEEQIACALTQLDPKLQPTADRDSVREQFANERKARIDSEIAAALRDGRITDADRSAWQQRLSNEAQFTNELALLTALKPVLKTHSLTLGRGDRKVELASASSRRHLVSQVLAEIANELNLDLKQAAHYDHAWTEAQKRHPALFDAMARPQPTRKK
jgi:phage I-like protein